MLCEFLAIHILHGVEQGLYAIKLRVVWKVLDMMQLVSRLEPLACSLAGVMGSVVPEYHQPLMLVVSLNLLHQRYSIFLIEVALLQLMKHFAILAADGKLTSHHLVQPGLYLLDLDVVIGLRPCLA